MTPARTPHRTYALGMRLFLASLSMLFGASLLGYVLIRLNAADVPRGTLHLPGLLWVSTGLVLGVSVTLQRSVNAVRQERQPAFRQWIMASLILSIAFLAIQVPSLLMLLREHFQVLSTQQSQTDGSAHAVPNMPLYGMSFFLILVHALHVIGGVIALLIVGHKGYRHAYDHESHAGPTFAAMYWHFLDVVWIILFGIMLLMG